MNWEETIYGAGENLKNLRPRVQRGPGQSCIHGTKAGALSRNPEDKNLLGIRNMLAKQ